MDKTKKIQYLKLQEEYNRRLKEDPIKNFVLHAKQKPFAESILKSICYEAYFFAANRSGKSSTGAYMGSYMARFGDPTSKKPTNGWVVSLDYPTSRDTVQPKYFDNGFVPADQNHAPFIPEREIQKWHVADQVLKLKNGSLIAFKSADSGAKKFQGAEKNWIHFDEEPPKSVYEEAILRIGAGKRLRIFGTCTLLPPEGSAGGVSWMYKDIIKSNNPDIKIFGASIFDNPYLDPFEIKRLVAKYPLHTPIGRIRLLGEYLSDITGAVVYHNFNRNLHIKPQPEILYHKPLCLFLDFNVEPMVMGIGQRDRDMFRVYREIVMEVGNIPKIVELFKEAYPQHGAEIYVYGDASGRNRTSQTGMDDYQVFLNHLRDYPAPIVLKLPEKNPPVESRVNIVNTVLKDEYGEISIEIDPSCSELIEDFESVVRNTKGEVKKSTNRKDSYYARTHISDALGYWLAYEQPQILENPQLIALHNTESINIKKPNYFKKK